MMTEYFGVGVQVSMAMNQQYMELFVRLSEILPAMSELTCQLPHFSLAELFHLVNYSGMLEFISEVMTGCSKSNLTLAFNLHSAKLYGTRKQIHI